jgi:LCP family protein required for cell wall assembly
MSTAAEVEGRPANREQRGRSSAHRWIAAALSALVPGLGHVYSRRYLRGASWFTPVLILSLFGFWALNLSFTDLVGAALDPSVLWGVFWFNIIGAIWRVAAAADAYRITEGSVSGVLSIAVGWAVLGLVIITPHLVAGSYTLDAMTLVSAVFVDDEVIVAEPVIPIGTDADIVQDPAAVPPLVPPLAKLESVFDEEMWDPDAIAVRKKIAGDRTGVVEAPFLPFSERVGDRRIIVLIAGGDAGPGRGGLRTDSMIVASLHTGTGKAALFGFPRNMGSIPLPKRFQNAFVDFEKRIAPEPAPVGEGEEPPVWQSCHCFPEQLNALYPFTRKWTRTYPDEIDPGMAALRDVLGGLMGIRIDYYVLVDMAAFVDLVDAIGGIDVNVRQPLQAEVSPPREGDPWAKVDVDVGWNHLDGPESLAYARARKGSSDYARMERQRCMLRGVAAKADPFTILRSFPAIVDAVADSVVTDVPRSFAAEFIGAAAGLDFDDIQTVGFTHAYWEPVRDHLYHPIPDVGRIRSKVQRVFAGQDSGDTVAPGESECDV